MPSNPSHRREFHWQPLWRRLSADPNRSKCSAEFDRIRLTRSTAIDNISNFSLFLSPAFIPLHECPAGPAESCKNRRLPRREPRRCIRASRFLTKSSLPLAGERRLGNPFTLTIPDATLRKTALAVDISFPFTLHFTRHDAMGVGRYCSVTVIISALTKFHFSGELSFHCTTGRSNPCFLQKIGGRRSGFGRSTGDGVQKMPETAH